MRYSEKKRSSLIWVKPNSGLYFRKVCITEVKNYAMIRYDITIDGKPYEGSESLDTALYLYDTLDNTCLREYYGHVKGLLVTEDSKTIKLKEEKIGKPLLSLRVHYIDGRTERKQLKLFTDEALPYLRETEPTTTKVEVLNSENEVVLEYE